MWNVFFLRLDNNFTIIASSFKEVGRKKSSCQKTRQKDTSLSYILTEISQSSSPDHGSLHYLPNSVRVHFPDERRQKPALKPNKNKPCLTEKCGERGPVLEGPQPVLALHEGLAEGPGAGPVAPVDGVDAIPVGGRRLAGQLAVWKCRKRGSSEFRGRFCVRIWFASVAELVTVNDRRRNRTAEQKV